MSRAPRSWIIRFLAVTAGFLTIPFITVLTALSSPPAASAAPQQSGIRPVQAAPMIPHGAQSLGAVSASAPLSGAVVLQPRDEGAVKAFISAVTNKNSPQFHHYLAPGQYAAAFGPSAATIATVKSSLQSAGLTVTSVATDGLIINFTGTASKVESAFHTGINSYRLADGTTGQATTSAVQLPAAIAGSVSSVIGLDQVVHAQPANIRRGPTSGSHPAAGTVDFAHPAGSPTACSDATTTAQTFGGLTDDQIANAYGAFGLYQHGDFGAGQNIAVYELEPFLPSDLQTFDTCYFGATEAAQMAGTNGAAGGRLSIIPVDGGQPTGPGSGEAILDVQDVSAIAPGANIHVYEAPNNTFGAIDEYSQIINNTNAATFDHVITSSWGLCEQAVQTGEPGIQQAENLLFEQAAAQGQTTFSAAGDTGSDTCNAFRTPAPVSPILSVNDPSSQPYVVAVGGTTIDDATQPPLEHVWNDGAVWGAGGGGISESWPMPTWQLDSLVPGVNNPTPISAANTFEGADLGNSNYAFCLSDNSLGGVESACRELPDVSAQADEFTGAVTIYVNAFGGWTTIGGTSSATPIWAGLLALINASQLSATCSSPAAGVGFANPLLYAVASNPADYAASFNDITGGNNDPYGASNLYPATTGYDMASGLGSPMLTGPSGGAGLAFYMCTFASSPARPAVTSITPDLASTSAPNTPNVTITGTGFAPGGTPDVADIQVGNVQFPLGSVYWSVTGPTTIVADFPPASGLVSPGDPTDGAGAYQVSVTLTNGETSTVGPNSVFEYVDQSSAQTVPAVTSVKSYGGPEAGGNVVDIFGTGFTGATSVTFGGVAATGANILSDTHIQATVPAFVSGTTTCAQDGSSFKTGENATNDVCQTEVVVTNAHGSSKQSSILPLYEGSDAFNANGVVAPPAGQEAMAQPTEYDYVPAPTVTSVSTSTSNPGSLASEAGDTVVTIHGTGFNLATLDNLYVGDPTQQASQDFSLVTVTGTEIQFLPPFLPAPTTDTTQLPVSVKTIAGQSAPANITYAGIPSVSAVIATAGPTVGQQAAPDTGGTPITVTGTGLQNQIAAVVFQDSFSQFSVGTQYNFTASSDTSLNTATVPQNPAIVDVLVCTVTSCSPATSLENTPSPADQLILYPPGDPKVDSVTPSSGLATGGTLVTITGENLGCATGVSFGTAPALEFSNEQALLDCGSTTSLQVLAPPGTAGSSVPVTVSTVESDLTGSTPATAAFFSYVAAPPTFTADSPPPIASRGRPYSYTFAAAGAPAPTFSVASGALPAGLHLNSTSGVLSGTPTVNETSHFVIKASNVAGSVLSPTLSITVDTAPVFTADKPPTARRGIAYSYTFRATGDPAPKFTVSSGGLPAGLKLNPVTGVLSGVAKTAGASTFKVTAANGANPAAVTPAISLVVAGADTGYRLFGSNGSVYGFGSEPSMGSEAGVNLAKPIVGMAGKSDPGYWLVASDGGIFTFGDARFYGSTGRVHLTKPIVGMAATPDGNGYWMVASDGGIFTFGDAHFYGSTGRVHLTKPIVGMAATPDGKGYWLVASDGGIFAFGDAHFYGSTGAVALKSPIVAMATEPDGRGYWMVAADGGLFTFGSARYHGSLGGQSLESPIVGMTTSPDGQGYGLISASGEVSPFGDFVGFGSTGNQKLPAPIIGMTD
jgi:hypothetical protein